MNAQKRADARPCAYIRKSTQGGADSKTDQITGVVKVAERHGDADQLLIMAGDWGISAARESTEKRLDFLRLLEMVENGEVSALYCSNVDRLARSQRWAAQLADACVDAGVIIHSVVKDFDLSTEGDRMLWDFAALTNAAEVRKMQGKMRESIGRRNEHIATCTADVDPVTKVCALGRSHQLGMRYYGQLPGEDATLVVDALIEAGSYQGAARLLIGAGVPSRYHDKGKSWSASTVRRVVLHEVEEGRADASLVPAVGARAQRSTARTRGRHAFQRLLLCPHDGSILTTASRPNRRAAYMCRIAQRSPAGEHPRPYSVLEDVVLEWAKTEADRVSRPDPRMGPYAVGKTAADEAKAAKLDAKWARFVAMAGEGLIDTTELRRHKDAIAAERRALETTFRFRLVRDRQGVDWTADPASVNSDLHSLWAGIELDEAMRPVRALWRVDPTEDEDLPMDEHA